MPSLSHFLKHSAGFLVLLAISVIFLFFGPILILPLVAWQVCLFYKALK